MAGLKDYLVAVCSAAILCAILKQVVGKGKLSSGTIKMLSGLFVAICIIAPWKQFSLQDLQIYNPLDTETAELFVEDGKHRTQNQIDAIITQKVEAYILEKANQLRVQVEVSVELSDEGIPSRSIITGELTKGEREELSAFLASQIGIQREMQIWK